LAEVRDNENFLGIKVGCISVILARIQMSANTASGSRLHDGTQYEFNTQCRETLQPTKVNL